MKFRTKIFLAIVLPSSALVAVAVVVALARITLEYEEQARDQLSRSREAFEGTITEQLNQLVALSKPFEGARFEEAIREAVDSGDLKTIQQQLDYQFQLVGGAPEFYELRDKKDKVLLRKSPERDAKPAPPQKWRDPEKALTAFDGHPFLAIRYEHEKGTLVIGKLITGTLSNLKKSFQIEIALVDHGTTVFSSLPDWSPAMGAEGAVYVGRTRYLAVPAPPAFSELTPVVFMADMSPVDRARLQALLFGAGGITVSILVAVLVSMLISTGISTPVETLVEAAHQVAAGDFKVKVEIGGQDEIGRLGSAFNEMTEGLRKRAEIMNKTLSPEVAEEFLKNTERRPERRTVTIVFMDIRGYTSGTEGMDPAEVMEMLNELMDLLSKAIVRNGGIVNKFLGDGLMAMFGAPKPVEGHALKAVRAGLEMQKWMARWNDRRVARGLNNFFSGIGINTGQAMCGKVGAQDRMEYTLIGEEVNLASRICGKAAPKQVLITKQTYDLVKDEIKVKELEPVTVKGLSYPIKVYEVLE
ncbi:MAG TPA: adenylate/guanylate cyclase domain-containing protein [Planctomycetota bacterium]|nr:adenylate/guanylate cyclase domain-containing protein [Planctomycetota bacterium]